MSSVFVLAFASSHDALAEPASPIRSDPSWPQWGGPNRNFTAKTSGPLSTDWSWWSGPKRLWRRELGSGYSSIVCDGAFLYTMYRTSPTAQKEYVIALDARTGRTVWQREIPAEFRGVPDKSFGGHGPNSTPLIVANRLFVVSSNAKLLCLDRLTGKDLWNHDLVEEYGAPLPEIGNGHSANGASPIAYGTYVIVPIGRRVPADTSRGRSLVAFDQATGSEVWKSLDHVHQHASPILFSYCGQDQLVLYAPPGIVAVDPNTGGRLWAVSVSGMASPPTPVFDGTDLVFFAGADDGQTGSAIKLTCEQDRIVPEIIWQTRRVRAETATPIIIDGFLYGSSDLLLFCADLKTGHRIWAKRGFPRATLVHADGKLIMLSQDGELTLATATPDGLTIHDQHTITEKFSLSAPTLVGTVLYVRDRRHILALELGADDAD